MDREFKDELHGKRIVLKRTKPEIETARIMFKTIDANREHLRPWLSWEKFTERVEDSSTYLKEKEIETLAGKKIEYGIYFEDAYAGNIAVFDINKRYQSAEVGYWLSSEFTGQGYMIEALEVVEKEFFENRNLNRMQLRCDERNIASRKVAKKCGYTLEGKIREDRYSEYFEDLRNTLVFSKLKSEYSKERVY
ncbi:GNAT family N-acetyltransferase [archaeon]|nr:GNAT family N-acetyltransferase [archaeon]MBT6823983.1 GNAT family N-acetyltransferase [archaeon]MBT7106953.1 GNAT family N-acetyltransferase [archaeon]MBT7297359.1 GNAT family N-acetyltransferase [archaeon]